jgi:hypothetical protein
MRYSDVCEVFATAAAAHASCSREWKISDTLVMCLEFDITSMTRAPRPDHSDRGNGPRLLRMTMFRKCSGGQWCSWRDLDPQAAAISEDENACAWHYREAVVGWVNDLADLPASTSTVVSERVSRSVW